MANQAILPVGPTGDIGIRNASQGSVQIIADVAGYFLAGSPQAAGAFQVLAPARILDTHALNNATAYNVAAGGSLSLFVGEAGVPVSGVDAVAVNLTLTYPTSSGHLTVYPSGTARPNTSNLNWVANQTVANLVLAPVGSDGRIVLANASTGTVELAADVVGYVRGAAPAPMARIDTYAGTGTCSDSDPQHPCLTFPWQVAVDEAGDVYIADRKAGLREVTPDGIVHTVVPGPGTTDTCATTGDGGPASAACVDALGVMRVAPGDLYISDAFNGRVRKVTPDGVITTIAGNGTRQICGDGGPVTAACLNGPTGIAFDHAGNLLVSDNGRIRQITPAGTITTIAGHGPIAACGNNGPAPAACLGPVRFAIDTTGRLYIPDSVNHRVWLMTPPS